MASRIQVPSLHPFRVAWATCAVGLLGACAAAPLSYVEGQPYTRTDPSLYPVFVVSVDNEGYLQPPKQPISLAPGRRSLLLQAAPARGAYRHVQKRVEFDVAPCTRYVFAARRETPMSSDWTLVVDRTEAVRPCDPDKERQKADAQRLRQSRLSS